MALTQDERQLAKNLKQNGKSTSEIFRIIGARRANPQPTETNRPTQGNLGDVATGFVKGIGETVRGVSTIGQGVLAAIDPTRTFKDVQEMTTPKFLTSEALEAKNPEQRAGKVIEFGFEILGGASPLLARASSRFLAPVVETVGETVSRVGSAGTFSGAKQTLSEVGERIPRFIERVRLGSQRAAERAETLKTATPAQREAIKVGLDDRFITTVNTADQPTLSSYKEMLDIAESTGKGTLKPKQQPSIVAGRAVEAEYDLIEAQRKAIGKQIEEASAQIPNKNIDMSPTFNALDNVLGQNRISITNGKLESPAFTKQQLARLQELYDQATSAGNNIDARLIHRMDQVFSQLQREARFDKLDNIFLETPSGQINAFRFFRDLFREQLDELSPEIRSLNNQYRVLRSTINDIENSIFKSPNFEATKSTDPAEFAKVNLRRLAGEAQSSPAFQAVVEDMDTIARSLGYEGARPDDLIYFAQEIRKLYPETIPSASFQGGIRTGLKDIAEKVLQAGAPNEADRQAALRKIIEEAIQSKK